MIRAEVNSTEVKEALGALPTIVVKAIENKVMQQTIDLADYVVAFKLQGQVLKHRSGALGRAVQRGVSSSSEAGVVKGQIIVSGDVKYARIHEYGGVIHHPGGTAYILSETGLAKFVSNAAATDKMPRTKPHDITIPERSFMRSSLAEKSDEIVAGIRLAAITGAKEAMGK